VRKEDVCQGIWVRLLDDYLRVPARTLGTIETVGNIGWGDFYFTIRWLNSPHGTRSPSISDRSLNLWLSDLEKFGQRKIPAWLRMRGNPNQLRLFEDL
jgi:hypothetical protein